MNTIMHIEESISTNKQLEAMDIFSLPPYFTLIADYQTQGRGRGNNQWHSQKNMNLLASTLLFSAVLPQRQFDISCAYSLAVYQVLTEYCHIDCVSIKWPNDIYINNNKIAGILIEHHISSDRIKYSIIGIGLNVNQITFPNWIPNPTSIALCTGRTYSIDDILDRLLQNFKHTLTMSHDTLHALYTSHLYKQHQWSSFTICGTGQCIQACIQGVSPQGCLQVLTSEQRTLMFELNQIKYNL